MNLLLRLYPGDACAYLIGSVAVQIAAVVLVAALLAQIGTRLGAAWRHSVWLTALVCVLLSPVLTCTLNAVGITLIALARNERPTSQNRVVRTQPLSSALPARPTEAPAMESGQEATRRSQLARPAASHIRQPDVLRALGGACVAVWLSGAVWMVIRWCHGMWTVSLLRRSVRPLAASRLPQVLAEIRQALQVDSLPSVVTSTATDRPIVIGLIRPLVIMPERLIQTLAEQNLADVLVHECAHVACRHHFAGLLQRLAATLFWPHPLVHLLNRELARAREEICDNYVLRRGDPRRYATVLLELSQSLETTFPRSAAIGLFHLRWTLEDRIAGLLDGRRRTMVRINRSLGGVLAAILFVPALIIAGTRGLEAQPAQVQPAGKKAASQAEKRGDPFLGLSELREEASKPSPEELETLRELVEIRLQTWRHVHAAYVAGGRGGSTADEARARTYLYVALARLAWAEQQDKIALKHLREALDSADRMVSAEKAAYEQGMLTLDVLLQSQGVRADLKTMFLRAGGTLPEPQSKRTQTWTLPPGEMPKPYPKEKAAQQEPRAADRAAETASVRGSITLNGKPVTRGKLMLYPETGKPIVININEDGSFLAKSVPVTIMTVTVTAKDVPPQYSSAETSALRVDIAQGVNEFQFDLVH